MFYFLADPLTFQIRIKVASKMKKQTLGFISQLKRREGHPGGCLESRILISPVLDNFLPNPEFEEEGRGKGYMRPVYQCDSLSTLQSSNRYR